MKKIVILLSGLFMASIFTVAALAADQTADQKLQSAEEIESLLDHLGVLNIDELIAAEAEFQVQRRRGGHHNHRPPVHRRLRHRGVAPVYIQPPRYPRPPRIRLTQCYAENARGESFSYRSYSPWAAQQGALDLCRRYSRRCFAAGCFTDY